MENNLKGVDEIEVIRRLWSKRILIIVVTLLCGIVGFISIRLHPHTYTVVAKINFEGVDGNYLKRLFQYGDIDFSYYSQKGNIATGDSLQISDEEKILLNNLKEKVNFEVDYLKHQIIILGNTADTLGFVKDLDRLYKVIQNNIALIHESYLPTQVDSLRTEISRSRVLLKEQARELIELQDVYQGHQNIEQRIQLKLFESEFLASPLLKNIGELRETVRGLENMEIVLSTAEIKSNAIGFDIRFLMRWMFFGFLGSSIWVLGSFQVQLLKKRRN